MTMKRGIGLLLAICVWGCGTSYDAKKGPGKDASSIPGDAAVTDVATPADSPIGVSTETGPPTDTVATNRDNAVSPDGPMATGVDVPLTPDSPQVVDTQAKPDQAAALDSGARPDVTGSVDGSAGKNDTAPDAAGSLPDVSFTLPDLSFTLPDLGAGGDCTTLAACCPSLLSALQSTCNTAVSNNVDTTCATLLSTFKLVGYCL